MYQLNSAKDVKGDERVFVDKFTRYRTAIEAYKRQHGGDLEGAYQAVTGEAWPAGRSVKIHDGRVEMTKDRTVRSVLGKYVLPAAAAVAAPYLLGALGGGAGGYIGADVASTAASAGGAGAAAAGAGAAAASGGLWGKIAGPLVSTGIKAATDLYGTKMQVDASKQAAETAAKAAEEALAWQKDVYGQRQTQLAPAIGVGNAATLRMGDLMGLQAPEGGYAPPPSSQPAPAAPPAAPAPVSTPVPAAPAVKMRAPTGQIAMVPQDQVDHYRALGATNA